VYWGVRLNFVWNKSAFARIFGINLLCGVGVWHSFAAIACDDVDWSGRALKIRRERWKSGVGLLRGTGGGGYICNVR